MTLKSSVKKLCLGSARLPISQPDRMNACLAAAIPLLLQLLLGSLSQCLRPTARFPELEEFGGRRDRTGGVGREPTQPRP
jgi:hypothetical protein